MSAGHVMVGFSVSLTVTVKPQVAVLGGVAVSEAVQVTVVAPLLKLEPLAGLQTVATPGQLSAALAVKVTLLEQTPAAVLTTMSAGHVMVGFSVSLTVTVKPQVAVLGGVAVSEAVQVTVVAPLLKLEPLAGLQTVATPGQLSAALAVKVTLLEQTPAAVLTTMSAGHVMVGFSVSLTVTVKPQVAVLGGVAVSEAVQVTVVAPLMSVEP